VSGASEPPERQYAKPRAAADLAARTSTGCPRKILRTGRTSKLSAQCCNTDGVIISPRCSQHEVSKQQRKIDESRNVVWSVVILVIPKPCNFPPLSRATGRAMLTLIREAVYRGCDTSDAVQFGAKIS
jgi:hypothetical protein